MTDTPQNLHRLQYSLCSFTYGSNFCRIGCTEFEKFCKGVIFRYIILQYFYVLRQSRGIDCKVFIVTAQNTGTFEALLPINVMKDEGTESQQPHQKHVLMDT